LAAPRAIVIHGHFYQPPRENPWLEAVEVQDSAAPFHDWNARVTADCYAPNTAARRVDSGGRILDIVDNFERISFDVGPTLFAWLEREAPAVARTIVDADRASAAAHGGHGNALAQVYNHQIMPLATRADKVTQVRWGLADFRRRFGRDAEGMWLPETAADDETLEVLAEAGVKFTILAPSQARRVRPLTGDDWHDVDHAVDPSRPYLWRGPRGLALTLFFYDGPISRAIAFEHLLDRGEKLAARLRAAFSDGRDWPQLVHCATDGESYGHHFRFGEMALAAALDQLAEDDSVAVTNYGAFLAAHPPTWEAEVHQRTSWSCAHGVARWQDDCGCRVRGDWHQRWRGPLREALDWLRDLVDSFYAARAGAYLRDPWGARDDYVDVLLDRGPAALDAFLHQHQRVPLDAGARLAVRRLLELQRNRLLMYTSCGWFFDEISGLEPVQGLRYAAMALQYLRDLGGGHHEPELEKRLGAAPSNVARYGDGREVYRRLVAPAIVDQRRVVAHYAITDLFADHPDDTAVYAYQVARLDQAREAYGGTALRIAHVRVRSQITGEVWEAMYALLHFGGHDVTCALRGWEGRAAYDRMKEELLRRFAHHSLADMVRGLDELFPGEPFALPHLFLDERRQALGRVIASVLDKHEETYRRIWEENHKLVRYLRQVDTPIPEALAIVARHVLEQEALAALARLDDGGSALPERAAELIREARALGLALDLTSARPTLQRALLGALDAVAAEPGPERVTAVRRLVEDAGALGLEFGLWEAQNRFFEIWRAQPDARPVLAPLATTLGFNLDADVP
jgi:alpha-amylase/alpha-mannosidase (GH57 family)